MGNYELSDFVPGNVYNFFRMNGNFVNRDPYSGYLSTIIPFSFGVYKFLPTDERGKIFLKYLGLVTFLASLFMLPLVNERASLVAVSIAIIFIYLFDVKIRNKYRQYFSTRLRKNILIIIIIFGMFTAAKVLYEMRPVSVQGRFLIWKITGNIIKEHPIFGSGFDRFPVEYDKYQAEYFQKGNGTKEDKLLTGNVKHSNNEYLQITADLGVIGLLLWAGIIFSALFGDDKNLTKSNNEKDNKKSIAEVINISAKASFISIIMVSMFSSPLRILPSLINFFFLIALISASSDLSGNRLQRIFSPGKNFRLKHLKVFSTCFLSLSILIAIFLFYKNAILLNAYKTWQNAADFASFGSYSKSEQKFKQVYYRLDNNGEFLFNYGGTLTIWTEFDSLKKKDNYSRAVLLLEASKKNFTDPKQYIDLGICYERLNKYEKAEYDYKYAANMLPNTFFPQYLLAKLLVKENKIEEAELLCKKILTAKVKIKSTAVYQMKHEIKTLLMSLK
jgi:tetratricopeptide (TPR) repeat protein